MKTIQLKKNQDNKLEFLSKQNNYESEEIEYSYDCDNCNFRRFMAYFGLDMNMETCWVDCTEEIKKEADETLALILSNLYHNKEGALLYLGNLPLPGYKN